MYVLWASSNINEVIFFVLQSDKGLLEFLGCNFGWQDMVFYVQRLGKL